MFYTTFLTSIATTSSTAWIDSHTVKNSTFKDILDSVEFKIGELSGFPKINQECFQILNYDVGQYYRKHNDYIPEHNDMPYVKPFPETSARSSEAL